MMVDQLTAEGRHYPSVVRVIAAVVAIFAALLACLQGVGAVDFVTQRDEWEFGETRDIVMLIGLQVVSIASLGTVAWTAGRFAAGHRLRWMLSAALLLVGICLTFISWVVWLANFSGG